jgi:ABC-type dipeptide/oligopeptide/nickel transport system permease subunit
MSDQFVSAPPEDARASGPGVLRQLLSKPTSAVAIVILTVLVGFALFAPWIAPFDPSQASVGPRLGAPEAAYLFGTDLHGRDVFSRVVWGARYSLPVGAATLLLGLFAGGALGVALGYVGGRFDAVGARAVDVLLGFPAIVMAIIAVTVLGVGLVQVVIAVAIADIPKFARVIRGATIVAKQNLFVESAVAMGARRARIMLLHILPTILPTVILLGTLNLGGAILATATLSFLGLGVQPPTPEWGTMLNDGRDYIRYAPWMMIAPGLALFLAIISVTLIGDRLSEIMDPRSGGRL